ncbi:Bacterial transcriptional activator domain protein [compost metagenome]
MLYKGGYLAENNYDWSEQRRVLLEDGYADLILRMNKWYKEAGQSSAAIRLLKKAIRQVPWNEDLHKELIRNYLANRDRLGALKQYDALKRMLLREYSAEPGDDIKRLLNLLR